MIKFNRTTEYGLIALRHMSQKQTSEPTSAREIADYYQLPFEITAKTLQRLRDSGLIHSAQGARGGYTLGRSLADVTLAEFLEVMEGPQSVVACASEASGGNSELRVVQSSSDHDCEYKRGCEIQSPMRDLNRRIVGFLSGIRLIELAGGKTPASLPVRALAVGEEP